MAPPLLPTLITPFSYLPSNVSLQFIMPERRRENSISGVRSDIAAFKFERRNVLVRRSEWILLWCYGEFKLPELCRGRPSVKHWKKYFKTSNVESYNIKQRIETTAVRVNSYTISLSPKSLNQVYRGRVASIKGNCYVCHREFWGWCMYMGVVVLL